MAFLQNIPGALLNMVQTFAMIQKIVNQDTITEEHIQELDTLIQSYMTATSQHSPKLHRKVKTHLLTHLVHVIVVVLQNKKLIKTV